MLHITLTGEKVPLLECGTRLESVTIAYQTYGILNADRSNAIFICHALTGDQYCTGDNPVTGKQGWWWRLIGPGLPIDTDRYFVICSNVLAGCSGTTGPKDINPATGKPWGLDFPVITIGDMVSMQVALLDALQIPCLLAVVGGSMGGMQALQWAASYPHRLKACIAIACSWRFTAQNMAFHEIGRQSIMADPDWHQGRYQDYDNNPKRGLAIARMAAHITYMSEKALHEKFGRKLQDGEQFRFGFDSDFQIQSYLRHQGASFVNRFDANSYLYISRACDYFDLAAPHGGVLARALSPDLRYCIVALSSDWMFPTAESKTIVRALNARAANVSFVEIQTDKGHDAFLLDEPEFQRITGGFLQACGRQEGVIT
jgi:homoserine O-acetyltransferase